MIKIDGKIAGYLCIDFSGEPAYEDIKGAWSVEQDYAVVHRMAFSREFVGVGLADTAFGLIEKVCLDRKVPYIRIDTDFPNKRIHRKRQNNSGQKNGKRTKGYVKQKDKIYIDIRKIYAIMIL